MLKQFNRMLNKLAQNRPHKIGLKNGISIIETGGESVLVLPTYRDDGKRTSETQHILVCAADEIRKPSKG